MGEAMRALAIVMVLCAALVPEGMASATEQYDALERGWYEYYVGRPMSGAGEAAAVLREDPTNLEAHRLYQHVWWSMGEIPLMEAQYRGWVEAEPDSETARVALALLLGLQSRTRDECEDEIQSLLEPLPENPQARLFALQALSRWNDREEEPEKWRDSVRAQCVAAEESGVPRLQRMAAIMRLHLEPVDTEQSAAVRKAVRKQPSLMMGLALALWPDLPDGPTAAGLRFFAVNQAEKALKGEDPIRLFHAATVLRKNDAEEGEARWEARLIELEPGWAEMAYPPESRAIHEATKRYDPDVGLAELDELEEQIPQTGKLRIRLEDARARLLIKQDRHEEAHEARKRMMAAGADHLSDAITFAKSARVVGEDLEEALGYLDATLDQLWALEFDPEGEMASVGYGRWRDYYNRLTANVLHERADVFRALDRDEEAAADLRLACALATKAYHHSALAGLYAETGNEDGAFEHLVRSHALKLESNPEPYELNGFPDALRTAWEARPYWHPGGLEGYMADRVTALADEDRAPS